MLLSREDRQIMELLKMMFESQGWLRLSRDPKEWDTQLVFDFYANFDDRKCEDNLIEWLLVRNEYVEFTPHSINRYYGVPKLDAEDDIYVHKKTTEGAISKEITYIILHETIGTPRSLLG